MKKKNTKPAFDKAAKTTKQKTKDLIEAIEQLDIGVAVYSQKEGEKKIGKVAKLIKSGADVENDDIWRAVLDLIKDEVAGKVTNMLFDAGVSPDKLIYGLRTENMPDPKIPTPLIFAAIEKCAGGVAIAALDRGCNLGQDGSWCENPLDFLAEKRGYFFGREEIVSRMRDLGLKGCGKSGFEKNRASTPQQDDISSGRALIFGGPALWGH